MKTLHSLLAAAAITFVLGAAASLQAGPGPQYWNRAAANVKPAPAAMACNSAGHACGSCQSCAGCAAKAASKANA